MSLNLSVPQNPYEVTPRITVIGVGGAGGNAVNNMIRSSLEGVEFIVTNTDSQALSQSICERRLQLGTNITQGLGAGSRPDVGRAAAEEVIDDLIAQLQGSNMVFITAGMGGGTGTGAAPVIARAAREHGILTVGVVTKPFHFEGLHRMRIAESGIQELQQYVDTLIVIPNQNLFRVANEKTTFADAFNMADEVLHCGVRGITDLMVMPGLINLDFADIRAVMTEMGKAMMGTGEAEGENRAVAAAEAAISNPLLDDVSMKGARGVLINITGGLDMTLFEVDEAANRIRDEVDPDANIIFGSTFNAALQGVIRISVVATGIEAEAQMQPRPVSISLVASRGQVVSAPASAPATSQGAQATQAAQPTAQYQPAAGHPTVAQMAVSQPAMAQPAMAQPTMSQPAASAHAPAERPAETYRQPDSTGTYGAAPEVAVRAAAEPARAEEPRREAMAETRPAASRPAERPFIAPPPVEASHRGMAPRAETPQPASTQAMPAAASSTLEQDRRRGPSLFSRVTGSAAAWARGAAADMREATPAAASSRLGAPEARPTTQAPARPSQPAQARLAGLDPRDRIAGTQAEEELLDIPAFLRRQAN
jgi:cell division protein FtsZ